MIRRYKGLLQVRRRLVLIHYSDNVIDIVSLLGYR